MCKHNNLPSREITVLFNVSIHIFKIKSYLRRTSVPVKMHLIAVNNRRIYPKVIYKKFTYSPNVFKVLKDPLFPVCLFYLKSFVRMTNTYSVLAHQIFYPTVREDNFFFTRDHFIFLC